MSGLSCVAYAAKSTEDIRGSIGGQLEDCRVAIERERGRRLVAEHVDESASAFRRSRGPGLAAAKRDAARLASQHGACELWVQHSDRLARGDGLSADHLAEVFFGLRRAAEQLRSVQTTPPSQTRCWWQRSGSETGRTRCARAPR